MFNNYKYNKISLDRYGDEMKIYENWGGVIKKPRVGVGVRYEPACESGVLVD